jgi:hypothetical protein
MLIGPPAARLIVMTKVVFAIGVCATLVTGCGDPKSTLPPISVAFDLTQYPIPVQLYTGASIPVAAIVTNDSQNAGVEFSCAPAGTCGTVSPNGPTGSEVPVCYLAPNSIPAQNPVTLTATSVTDPTKFASVMITIVSGPANPCPAS